MLWSQHIKSNWNSLHSSCNCCVEEERRKGYKKKDFKQAKLDFVDEMLRWSGAKSPSKVLDVGCGIGGTTRILAKNFSGAQVQGTAPLVLHLTLTWCFLHCATACTQVF